MGRPPAKKPAVVVTVRFDPAVKAAMQRAAKADARTVSALVQKVMADWLRDREYLK